MDWKVSDVFREETAGPPIDVPANELPTDRKLEADERARLVWSMIQTLPAKYRVPLVLFHYEGMSYKEIADTLALSLSAVETRIHRAKKQLARKLEPWLGRI
jgi:RNA polymerase sigma-70 factor (ECF subfamily)